MYENINHGKRKFIDHPLTRITYNLAVKGHVFEWRRYMLTLLSIGNTSENSSE